MSWGYVRAEMSIEEHLRILEEERAAARADERKRIRRAVRRMERNDTNTVRMTTLGEVVEMLQRRDERARKEAGRGG